MSPAVDRNVIATGAAVILAILVPPVVIVRALLGADDDSPLWSVIPLVFLVSFPIGGGVAAARASSAPVKHGAIAGAIAFGAALAVAVVRNVVTSRSMSITALVTAILFWQIATSLAALGALLADRRRRRRELEAR